VKTNGNAPTNRSSRRISRKKGAEKVILGLGKTGLSCARYLSRLGVPFRVMDEKNHPEMRNELAYLDPVPVFSQFTKETSFDPREVDELIVSPGIPLSKPAIQKAIEDGIGVNGDVNIFLKQAVAPVIGITGSNGKSTVTALLGEILARHGLKVGVGGNIGTPCLDLLETDCDIYVLEFSSYQLEVVDDARCEIATVLNLSPDHLDRYPSDSSYYQTKTRIYSNAKIALRNIDLRWDFKFDPGTEVINFGANVPDNNDYGIVEDDAGVFLCQGERKILDCSEILIQGHHNAENALVATAIAERLGVPTEVITATLRRFKGLAHRCELVLKHDGVTFINDSKSTNPGSTIAAIEGFVHAGRQLVLILGGQSKGADFTPLKEAILKTGCEVLLYGEDAQLIKQNLSGCSVTSYLNLAEAVHGLADLAHGQIASATPEEQECFILFSPACASFDQFKNFEDRGDQFRLLVEEMIR